MLILFLYVHGYTHNYLQWKKISLDFSLNRIGRDYCCLNFLREHNMTFYFFLFVNIFIIFSIYKESEKKFLYIFFCKKQKQHLAFSYCEAIIVYRFFH